MKVGLLTVYYADYGSYYHAISLCNELNKIKDVQCEIINESIRYKYSFKLKISSYVRKYSPAFIVKLLSKHIAPFRTYVNLQKSLNTAPISPRFNDFNEINAFYDLIIIGSDELWSSTNKNITYVPEYFGLNISVPHISYSTSGITMDNSENVLLNYPDIKSGLCSFSSIAVRDKKTAEWVGKVVNRHIPIVLDPTLLNPFFKIKNAQIKPYILVYGEHYSDEQIASIKKYAADNSYEIIAVSWRHSWCDSFADVQSPEKLQTLFAESAYCAVSTFHGTVFSLVQERPFTSFNTAFRGAKVKDLLEQLDLTERLSGKEIIRADINYEDVNKRIASLREYSKNYLEKALESAMIKND